MEKAANKINELRNEIEATEEILNDGIDYPEEFIAELTADNEANKRNLKRLTDSMSENGHFVI